MTTREELIELLKWELNCGGTRHDLTEFSDEDYAEVLDAVLAKLSEDDPERVGRAIQAIEDAQKRWHNEDPDYGWTCTAPMTALVFSVLDATGPVVVVREQDAMNQWKARAEKAEADNEQLAAYVKEAAGDESVLMPVSTMAMFNESEAHRLRVALSASEARAEKAERRARDAEAELERIKAEWSSPERVERAARAVREVEAELLGEPVNDLAGYRFAYAALDAAGPVVVVLQCQRVERAVREEVKWLETYVAAGLRQPDHYAALLAETAQERVTALRAALGPDLGLDSV